MTDSIQSDTIHPVALWLNIFFLQSFLRHTKLKNDFFSVVEQQQQYAPLHSSHHLSYTPTLKPTNVKWEKRDQIRTEWNVTRINGIKMAQKKSIERTREIKMRLLNDHICC